MVRKKLDSVSTKLLGMGCVGYRAGAGAYNSAGGSHPDQRILHHQVTVEKCICVLSQTPDEHRENMLGRLVGCARVIHDMLLGLRTSDALRGNIDAIAMTTTNVLALTPQWA